MRVECTVLICVFECVPRSWELWYWIIVGTRLNPYAAVFKCITKKLLFPVIWPCYPGSGCI